MRFNAALPKQYHKLLGKEVVGYSVDALKASELTDAVVVIASEEFAGRLQDEYSVETAVGGTTRNASLRIGLDYIKENYPSCKKVFINEAVRPFLTAGRVDMYYGYLDEYDAVITAQPVTDSLGREGEAVTDRAEYYLIQAPEAFRFDLLYSCFDADSQITATVQQLPVNRKVMRCFDYKHNMKITFNEDLLYAEQIMKLYR